MPIVSDIGGGLRLVREKPVKSPEPAAAEEPAVISYCGYAVPSKPKTEEIIPASEPVVSEEPEDSSVAVEAVVSTEPPPVETSDRVEVGRPEGIETAGDPESMELSQPRASPYESEAATILIGQSGKRYTVPLGIANRAPYLKRLLTGLESKTVALPDVDSDIGHTFIHYLYTGEYQTLNVSSEPDLPSGVVEYKRSVLAYRAAVSYGLDGLADHAKRQIQLFDDGVSIFHIIVLARRTFPRITQEAWFSAYLTSKILASFEADDEMFQREEFFEGYGEALDFDKFLGKVMANAYSQRMSSLRAVAGLESSRNRSTMINDEGIPTSNDTSPDQSVRDELITQYRRQPSLTLDSFNTGIPPTSDDTWVECEDDGNSTQVMAMTPSSSPTESPQGRQDAQTSSQALQQLSTLDIGNRVCPLWLQHSVREDLCKGCPKCKSHMVSMFAKLLVNNA
ncbi:uncharacterized protein BJX67DRAFT_380884 [Aspergillus lucknowensis]|uniref:BTB domain-containing protein n=1 Tax=Aspergillus lucknowensis TaxID=176173 RepID=A0ABR4LSN0_9EURO